MVRSIHDAANLSVDLAVGWRMTDFTPDITLSRALTQPNLFGGTFGASSFWTWRTVAKMIDGLPLTEAREVDLVKECTGRTQLPTAPVRRLILLAGRRAGKDPFFSAVAVWRAALCVDWCKYLSDEQAVASFCLPTRSKPPSCAVLTDSRKDYRSASPDCSTCKGPGMSRSAGAASSCSLRRQQRIIETTTTAPTTASAIANGRANSSAPVICAKPVEQCPGHRTRAVGNHEVSERHPVCSRNEPDDRSQHSDKASTTTIP
jgi:hypothetical protein